MDMHRTVLTVFVLAFYIVVVLDLHVPGCPLPEGFYQGKTAWSREWTEYLPSLFPLKTWLKLRCQPTYKVLGAKTVFCMANGHWQPDLPQCIKRTCDPPPVKDGEVWRTWHRTGFPIAQLDCLPGYTLQDPKVYEVFCKRINGRDMMWVGTWPACRELARCPDPGPILEGTRQRRALPDLHFQEGTIVTFECLEGLQLIGSNSIICMNDSKWSLPAPACKPNIYCPSLPFEPRGTVSVIPTSSSDKVAFYVPGMTVKLTCNPGFYPDPMEAKDLFSFCQDNGTWDKTLTTCKRIMCSKPVMPENTFLVNDDGRKSFFEDEVIRVMCRIGFRLLGVGWNRCTDKGWLFQTPVCIEMTHHSQSVFSSWSASGRPNIDSCHEPEIPKNGYQIGYGSKFGDTVRFGCNFGFTLVGSGQIKCLENGQWDEKSPRCKEYYLCGEKEDHGNSNEKANNFSEREEAEMFWPWVAYIQMKSTHKSFCVGTIIGRMWVLTAAHCLENVPVDQITVFAGRLGKTRGERSNLSIRKVSRVWIHPFYSKEVYLDYDVAILKLAVPFNYGNHIKSICLAHNVRGIEVSLNLYRHEEPYSLVGFNHGQMQTSGLFLQRTDVCTSSVRGLSKLVTSRTTCFHSSQKGEDQIENSGSPLMQMVNDGIKERWVQTGILSWHFSEEGHQIIGFLNLAKVHTWIRLVTATRGKNENTLSERVSSTRETN